MDTESWFVIAGKNPTLTRAELDSTLINLLGPHWSISSVTEELLEIKAKLPEWSDLDRLGSVIKAGVWLGTIPGKDLVDEIASLLKDSSSSRFDYGLSFIGKKLTLSEIHQLNLAVKRHLKSYHGKPIRAHLPKGDTVVSPVVVRKHLLPKGGRELVFVPSAHGWRVAETIWVHDFESWSKREYDKPYVDKARGMIPHKLARTMINLSSAKWGRATTVLDPFCGVGTVLIEAKEMGFSILGADIDRKAVHASQSNLGLSSTDHEVWQSDATKLQLPRRYNCHDLVIVTEPDLGPVWHEPPTQKRCLEVASGLVGLYKHSLSHWRTLIEKGTAVVMVFPVIVDQPTFGMIVDSLKDLKYSTEVSPIRYERPGQMIKRDIVKIVAD